MENEKSIRDLWPENIAEALPENPFHKKEHQSLLVVFQTSSTAKRLNENLEAKKAGFEYCKQELKEIQEQAIQFEENYSAASYWLRDCQKREEVLTNEFSRETDTNIKKAFDIILRDKQMQTKEAKIEIQLKESEKTISRNQFISACSVLKIHQEGYLELNELAQKFINWLYHERKKLADIPQENSAILEKKNTYKPSSSDLVGELIATYSVELDAIHNNSKTTEDTLEDPKKEPLDTMTQVNLDGSITTTVKESSVERHLSITADQSKIALENVK